MENKFEKFLNKTFKLIPKSKEIEDFREEMMGNLLDKASELKNNGLQEEEIYKKCIESLGNYQETIRHLLKVNNLEMIKDTLNRGNLYLLIILFATMSVYFITSFITQAWSYTWIIFVAVAIAGVFYILGKLSNKYYAIKSPYKLSIVNNIITVFAILVIYLTVSFTTKEWGKTWILFTLLPSLVIGNLIIGLKVAKKKINKILVYALVILIGLDLFFILAVFVPAIGFGKAWIAIIIAIMVALLFAIKEANEKIKK